MVYPTARQYGVTYEEFWYGDPRILEVAQKAYIRDKSYTAWLYGQYNATAYGIVMANAFAKKGKPPAEYPKWQDPVEKLQKMRYKEENYEVAHHKQQMWFYNMINN